MPTPIDPLRESTLIHPLNDATPAHFHAPASRIVEGEGHFHVPDPLDPFLDVDVEATITRPDGSSLTVPCFWAGGSAYRFRVSPGMAGDFDYSFRVARGEAECVSAGPGRFTAIAAAESVALLQRGAPHVHASKRYLEHANGEPFFWLADSWWFAMCERIRYPEEFLTLVRDRAEKGFTAIQFAIGFACDIHAYDPRDANEAGHIWEPDFETINPDYFDFADDRVLAIVEHNLVPNIVGMWGYYLPLMGREKAKLHWRYLIARYGALPVTWTLCGESRLSWYAETDAEKREANRQEQLDGWAEVGRFVKENDPWGRALTCHIGPKPGGKNVPPLSDTSVLDFHFLQPGHSDYDSVAKAQEDFAAAQQDYPGELIMVGECCFEGMQGGAGPKAQRNLFWTSVLSGMPGYSYGVDALWQMNRADQPFGASVAGQIWGNAPWDEAYQWLGSQHLGAGRKILARFPWHRFEPHPEWIDPAAGPGNFLNAYAAGIPGEVRLFYFPRMLPPWGKPFCVRGLEAGVDYLATFINPMDGSDWPVGRVTPDSEGNWPVPPGPILQDWVLALRRY